MKNNTNEESRMIPQQWASPCGNQCTNKYAALTQIPCNPFPTLSLYLQYFFFNFCNVIFQNLQSAKCMHIRTQFFWNYRIWSCLWEKVTIFSCNDPTSMVVGPLILFQKIRVFCSPAVTYPVLPREERIQIPSGILEIWNDSSPFLWS